jgi:adenylyltransferase/sulfurtransferase
MIDAAKNQPLPRQIAIPEAMRMVGDGQAVFIDVREQAEYDDAHIEGAVLVPVSVFDVDKVVDAAGDKEVIFLCRSGRRADNVCVYFKTATGRDAGCLEGSMLGWLAAGMPVESA